MENKYYDCLCKCGCGEKIEIKFHHKYYGIPKFIHGHNYKNVKRGPRSEEVKEKIRKIIIEKWKDPEYKKRCKEGMNKTVHSGKESYAWKYGSSQWYHTEAWRLFGKDYCEICGRSLKDNIKETGRRFDMHCMSIPKNYTIMEQSNWKCVCNLVSTNSCHRDLEKM